MPQYQPIQKILFGSPGTGKSHQIDNSIIPIELGIDDKSNVIKTVFHPEYTYGDFMGKLMPMTDAHGKVEYIFYSGHFLKALGKAYKNIINANINYEKERADVLRRYKTSINKTHQNDFTDDEKTEIQTLYDAILKTPDNVVLTIDEINRGNSASIFGTVFQLLDRSSEGWSSYDVMLSDLEKIALFREIDLSDEYDKTNRGMLYYYGGKSISEFEYNKYINWIYETLEEFHKVDLKKGKIKLPPNLSLIATMNTSDNSIYFMDSAFKRRWDWEFVEIEDEMQRESMNECFLQLYGENVALWCDFVDKLNSFIKRNYKVVRKIEDKQIGYRFINTSVVTEVEVKNKLMFFVWDSVFSNNKKPLAELLGLQEQELVTFGQFTQRTQVTRFVKAIIEI
ncbi:hypothetical protein O3303_21040 (plasmid) [Hymenobacter canadensis]|uniref:Restriction endonuclease n=2 Tax=Hymenobacter canadensis TaxID=2999067 RepID=A0ABY7LXQ3_9BACT|nr:hypothetical protein [Hymenobacter canadensis]WBA44050.1 hypothetical protein O3303_21040 [Hymenobacter canadensis]